MGDSKTNAVVFARRSCAEVFWRLSVKTKPVFLLLASIASAATASQEHITHCKSVGAIASDVMQMRQEGVSLPEALDAAAGHEEQRIFLLMLQTAYRLPIIAEDKQSAIDAFRDQHILNCLATVNQPNQRR